MLEERPAEFYFRKLGPYEYAPKPDISGYPACVGIAFDALVKTRLAKELGFHAPSLEFMLHEVTTERERALKSAEGYVDGYVRSGAYRRLLEECPVGVAVDGEDFAPGTQIPICTRIDCIIKPPGSVPVILDWKVKGSGTPGTSPTPGYCRLWDTDQPGIPFGGHPKAGLPLEELNPEWATQLVMYGWAQGYPMSAELTAAIDEVCVWHGDRVRVASFRHPISLAFQQNVKTRIEAAWRKIESREVLDPNLNIEQARILL